MRIGDAPGSELKVVLEGERRGEPLEIPLTGHALGAQDRLVGVIGPGGRAIRSLSRYWDPEEVEGELFVTRLSTRDLPRQVEAYSGLDHLVWLEPSEAEIPPDALSALLGWVASGRAPGPRRGGGLELPPDPGARGDPAPGPRGARSLRPGAGPAPRCRDRAGPRVPSSPRPGRAPPRRPRPHGSRGLAAPGPAAPTGAARSTSSPSTPSASPSRARGWRTSAGPGA